MNLTLVFRHLTNNFYTLCIFETVYQELQVRVKCPRRLEHLLLPSKKLVIVMNIKTNGTFPTTKIAKTVTKLFSKAALKAIQSMTLAHFWNSMTMKIGKIIKTNGVKHAQ